MANWSSLPHELISSISDRLPTVEDFSSFTAVCRSFQSATSKVHRRTHKVSQQPPWLLLSCHHHHDGNSDRDGENPPINKRGLLSMYRNKKKFFMNLPELHGRHCWGTPYGWIVTLGLDRKLHLFNPLNRRRIALPDITCSGNIAFDNENEKAQWMRYTFIRRALLVKKPIDSSSISSSSDDLFDEFLVFITTAECGRLRVMKHRTDTWVYMNETRLGSGFVSDVVNYNGRIYGLCSRGSLLSCSNLDGPDQPTAVEILPNNKRLVGDEKLYLVESDGDLLMVARHVSYDLALVVEYLSCESSGVKSWYTTSGFDVFKLNELGKEWVEIEDLGDRALFVGDCQSISLSSSEVFHCLSNCIYFTDDNYEQFKATRGHDMGVFYLTDKSIKPFYEGADTLSSYSTPSWFIPTFI